MAFHQQYNHIKKKLLHIGRYGLVLGTRDAGLDDTVLKETLYREKVHVQRRSSWQQFGYLVELKVAHYL